MIRRMGFQHICVEMKITRMATTVAATNEREEIPVKLSSTALEVLLADLLNREGELHYPLVGESMRPTLPAGSLLTVKPLTHAPAIGDLLVFVWAGQFVTHRLIRVEVGANHTRRLITQGDNCIVPDPVLSSDCVIGQVSSATYRGRVIWPVASQTIWRWRWIVRYYVLAARRRLYRLLRREES